MSTPIIPISIITAFIILYMVMGILNDEYLRIQWQSYYKIIKKHPLLTLPAIVLWPAIFITFITWRTIEPLTIKKAKKL